jgi:hypothetical protein
MAKGIAIVKYKPKSKKRGKAHKSLGPKATPKSKYRGQGR